MTDTTDRPDTPVFEAKERLARAEATTDTPLVKELKARLAKAEAREVELTRYSDTLFGYVLERCEKLQRHGIRIAQDGPTDPFVVHLNLQLTERSTRLEAVRAAEGCLDEVDAVIRVSKKLEKTWATTRS